VIETHQLLHIDAIVKTVRNGSDFKGGDAVINLQISCPAIVDNVDMPKAMLGVTPPSEDDFAIKSYFATSGIDKYCATSVAEDCSG
jgi:hypothetical protein